MFLAFSTPSNCTACLMCLLPVPCIPHQLSRQRVAPTMSTTTVYRATNKSVRVLLAARTCRRRGLANIATSRHPFPTPVSVPVQKVPGAWSARVLSTLPDDVLYLPMPKLSPSMTHGKVTKWLKAEGDEINEYDAILKLSTDSLYAPGEEPAEGAAVDMIVELAEVGFVGKLLVKEGEVVEVGQTIMIMCEEEEHVEKLGKARNPGVDFYRDDDAGLRIATFQGYLDGKTPKE